jgi:hypothetical protein
VGIGEGEIGTRAGVTRRCCQVGRGGMWDLGVSERERGDDRPLATGPLGRR